MMILVRSMGQWLRWILVVVTVGGGFDGIVNVAQDIYALKGCGPSDIAPLVLFTVLYAFTAWAGLLFADDPERTRPLVVSLILQVPTFWSQFLSYRFIAGLELLFTLARSAPVARKDGTMTGFGFSFGPSLRLGSHYWLYFSGDWRLGCGINLFALGLLVLLCRHARRPNQSLEPTA
jgi:hypothetical protein